MAMASEDPFHNPLEALVGYQLRRASAALMGELGQDLAALGLKPTEASVLALIDANPGITQSDLGRILQIQRANMAPLAAVLDRSGLIAREKVDGRSQGLTVTPVGADMARAIRTTMELHDVRILSAMPETTRTAFAAILPILWRGSNR